MPTSLLTSTPEWQALQTAAEDLGELKLSALFEDDARRAEDFCVEAAGLKLDYSRNLLTREHFVLLQDLARASDMEGAISAMFSGAAVNNTEQRPALHVALRSPEKTSPEEQAVHACLERMEVFVGAVQAGRWRGHAGNTIRDVVNIGIGGSDLGPAMVYQALSPYHHEQIRCHFISNVDPVHLDQCLQTLAPDTTLFILASKSFTTLETSQNAEAARRWVLASGVPEAGLEKHFVAVSANVEKAEAFGIAPANIFPMWDWVGGRYSLWSAIGLPIALGLGMDHFRALLGGAHAMDRHFHEAPPEHNMPVIMALLNLWYSNFLGAQTRAILPYLQNLHLFPAFLQQLDMESLGKSVHRDGSPLTIHSGSIVWGSAGTNGQHSFHQLLHQGTHLIPVDFIAAARSHADPARHQHLLANCFAQSQALMTGKSREVAEQELRQQGMDAARAAALAPHRAVPGNRPSNTILMEQLTPDSLGGLIAAYEHMVYAFSVLTRINAFDQWGVELGKALSTGIHDALLDTEPARAFDASTNALINYCKNRKDRAQ